MASGLAHELNQPLMAIIGYTDHCIQSIENNSDDPEKMTTLLHDTSREAKRAGAIIKRLRRLVSKGTTSREASDLNEIVRESVELLKPAMDVDISVELEDNLPNAMVDRIQLQQVVMNLGQNAIQAMEASDAHPVRLKIKSGQSGDDLFVEVVDSGPGLDPENIERLFDPFFTRNKPEGLGLGLAISKKIVEAHDGQLTVQSNEDSGLTFRFTIPSGCGCSSKLAFERRLYANRRPTLRVAWLLSRVWIGRDERRHTSYVSSSLCATNSINCLGQWKPSAQAISRKPV